MAAPEKDTDIIEATLCFPLREREVLLGMKKVRFGAGWWNGFGGRVKPEELLEVAALRELREESGLAGAAAGLDRAGSLLFHWPEAPTWRVAVFRIREWKGRPVETDEMRPRWFAFDALPFEAMWPTDREWVLPTLLGRRVEGEVRFDAEKRVLEKRFVFSGV